jgi:hypothetical protein
MKKYFGGQEVIYLSMSDGSRAEVREAMAAEVEEGLLICLRQDGTAVARFDAKEAWIYGSEGPRAAIEEANLPAVASRLQLLAARTLEKIRR